MSSSTPWAAFRVGDRVRVHQNQENSVTTYDGIVISANPNPIVVEATAASGGMTITLEDGDNTFMVVHRVPIPPGHDCAKCP